MNLAKSLNVSEKNYFNHRAPMQWNGSFWPKISPIFAFRLHTSIRYSRIKACFLNLIKDSNYRPFRISKYVNSLTLRDTHRFKKGKNETSRTYRGLKKCCFSWMPPGSLIGLIQGEEWSNESLSMESNCRPQLGSFKLNQLKIWANFKHINSLLGERHMIRIFLKKHVQDTRW
jgi:hypothetical protein